MAKKQDLPAMPFYVGDWLKCPEVKVLPPDVRGLWFDMICYMWESVERGVMVKPNLEPYNRTEIVRMIGLDCSNTGAWLDVLIDNGVCAVRDDGAIYSRRMVKDEDIRLKRQAAGRIGGTKTTQRKKATPLPPQAPSQDPPPPLTPEEQAKAEKAKKYKYAEKVSLTRDEYTKLVSEHSEAGAKWMIDKLSNYKGSNGKKYVSDYKAILSWVVDSYNEYIIKNGGKINGAPTTGAESSNQPDFQDTL